MKINKEKHQELISKIKKYTEYNVCGANLHLVLDDYNLESHHIEFCRKQAEENKDSDGVHICEELLKLSFLERNRLFRWRFGKF